MKNPFDRIVGPDGEQVFGSGDGIGADEALSERDEFILRCLNAAVNLYGIVTAKEVCWLYNGYAKNHDAPVSAPLSEDELHASALRLLRRIAEKDEGDVLDVLVEDAWFTPIYDDAHVGLSRTHPERTGEDGRDRANQQRGHPRLREPLRRWTRSR